MKIDPFIANFGLPLEQQAKLQRYTSPETEASVFKQVPLTDLEEMKFICRRVTGRKVRVMYRGPRKNGSYSTRRCWATHASIYLKDQ